MPPTLLPERRWKRNALSALLLFHLVAVPLGSYWTESRDNSNALKKLLSNYVYGLRIRQYWALFSPDPRHIAVKYSALIVFRNGQSKRWRRPYSPNWNFFERHLAYNFQKWDLVSDNLDHKSGLWDSLDQYLLKTNQDPDGTNPIREIQFIRSYAPWPPPNPTGYVGGETKDLRWTDQVLFRYDASTKQFL
jgi:hypothetical protein